MTGNILPAVQDQEWGSLWKVFGCGDPLTKEIFEVEELDDVGGTADEHFGDGGGDGGDDFDDGDDQAHSRQHPPTDSLKERAHIHRPAAETFGPNFLASFLWQRVKVCWKTPKSAVCWRFLCSGSEFLGEIFCFEKM